MVKRAIVEAEEALRVPKGLYEIFEGVALEEIHRLESTNGQARRQIESYEEALRMSKDLIVTNTAKLEVLKKEEPALKAESHMKAEELVEKLSRNVCVDTIAVSGDFLIVTTTLLFTDIRPAAGARKKDRACIGAYKIYLPIFGLNKSNVRCKNILFKDHWAISGERICWGSWGDDVEMALGNRNFYEALEIILALLREAELDGAAYRPSHSWRDDRMPSVMEKSTVPFVPGDYVICTGNHDGLDMTGRVAVVERSSSIHSTLKIKRVLYDGDMSSDVRWVVPVWLIEHIAKDVYDAKDRYDLRKIPTVRGSILEELDRIPDGAGMEAVASLLSTSKPTPLSVKELSKRGV